MIFSLLIRIHKYILRLLKILISTISNLNLINKECQKNLHLNKKKIKKVENPVFNKQIKIFLLEILVMHKIQIEILLYHKLARNKVKYYNHKMMYLKRRFPKNYKMLFMHRKTFLQL